MNQRYVSNIFPYLLLFIFIFLKNNHNNVSNFFLFSFTFSKIKALKNCSFCKNDIEDNDGIVLDNEVCFYSFFFFYFYFFFFTVFIFFIIFF